MTQSLFFTILVLTTTMASFATTQQTLPQPVIGGSPVRRTGVVLPLTGHLGAKGRELLVGMQAWAGEHQTTDTLFVRDSKSQAESEGDILDELYRTSRITKFIAGFQSLAVNNILLKIRGTRLSGYLLNLVIQKSNALVENFYPSVEVLTHHLGQECQARRIKRIAILYPEDVSGFSYSQSMQKSAASLGIQITAMYSYRPGDYATMEDASRTLFQLKPQQRPEEYRDLVASKKAQLNDEKSKLDLSTVQLDPIQEFDAIFVPDHFKAVRHLVRIFRYLGAKRVTMIGGPSWRSPGLINPYDDLLAGAFFADYVGLYSELPLSIRPPTLADPYLIDTATAEALDFRWIGWNLMDNLAKRNYTTAAWPSYIYGVGEKVIYLKSKNSIGPNVNAQTARSQNLQIQ